MPLYSRMRPMKAFTLNDILLAESARIAHTSMKEDKLHSRPYTHTHNTLIHIGQKFLDIYENTICIENEIGKISDSNFVDSLGSLWEANFFSFCSFSTAHTHTYTHTQTYTKSCG